MYGVIGVAGVFNGSGSEVGLETGPDPGVGCCGDEGTVPESSGVRSKRAVAPGPGVAPGGGRSKRGVGLSPSPSPGAEYAGVGTSSTNGGGVTPGCTNFW